MTQSELFLLAMLVIFVVPYAVWRGLGRAVWAPLVVVQIICGILLGPGIFGAVFPALQARMFAPEVMGMLNGIALWAVTIFVFLAGLELDLKAAWGARDETVTVAGFALAVPLALGVVAGAVVIQWQGWSGANAAVWQAALGIGMACAVTALPILVLFLGELGILRAPLGQRVLCYSSLDDMAIWVVLALILLDVSRLGLQAGFVLGFAAAAWLVRRMMLRQSVRDRWALGLVWLIVAALAADRAGLHYMVGAFLAGAVMDADWFGKDRLEDMRATVLMLVMPVFFLSTGLRTRWDMGGLAVMGVALVLLVASVGGKHLGVELAGRRLGWPVEERRVVGWLLQTKALIMIIFANILLDKAVITPAMFTAMLLMALGSTMLTMPMVIGAQSRAALR